ncbi:MAG: thioesterase family protein [Novosphingobium sp.]
MSFAALLNGAEPREGGCALTIPESWHQGRTAYGGLSSALAFAVAKRVGGDLPPLRAAQVSMIAPIAGAVEIRAREVRRGRNATWIAAEIHGGQGLGFAACFVFMSPAESDLALNRRRPPDDLIPVDEARGFANERGPAFRRHHFEVRFALPRTPEKAPEMCWWVRARDAAGLDPAAEVLLTADALPPGAMPLLAATVPVSTMQWQVNLLTPAPTTQGWWLLRSTGDYAGQGCSSQHMEMWNEAGEPIAFGMQSVALFG